MPLTSVTWSPSPLPPPASWTPSFPIHTNSSPLHTWSPKDVQNATVVWYFNSLFCIQCQSCFHEQQRPPNW
jgi:hypothetical protein